LRGPPLTEFRSRLNLPPRFITPSILLLQLPDAVDLLQIPLTLSFPPSEEDVTNHASSISRITVIGW
jgi:hypothetical protein